MRRWKHLVVAALVLIVSVGLPIAASATVSISRAELNGSRLRIEGEAAANRQITVDGVVMTTSDSKGRFKIDRDPYSPPADCTVAVNDGSAVATSATLSGCTVSTPPPPDIALSGVLVNPSSVTGGSSSTGSVLMSGPAPSGGTTVSLLSDAPAVVTVPSSVTVEAGNTAASFTVTTQPVSSSTSVTITATFGGVSRTASLTVIPDGAILASLTLNPGTVVGGDTSQGVVSLTQTSTTDAVISLSSSNSTVASVPASVTVTAGSTAASFDVTTQPLGSATSVTISATYDGIVKAASLAVTGQGGTLASLIIQPDLVVGGETAQGTVALTQPAASDTVVTLSNTNPSVASVPASVTVQAGATSVVFTVTTFPVSSPGFAVISGTAGGVTVSDSINVNPGAPPSAPSVASVTFAPASTGGGGAATGTVTLSGPAGDGAIVTLSSSDPNVVQTPAEVVVPANASSVAFPVTTSAVTSNTEVTITATAKCCGATGSRTGTMTVTTDAPPPADVVQITDVRWKKCVFSIKATSTNPDAILTVHLTSSGSEVLRLTNLGDGRYEGERVWRPPGTNVPVDITLRSNFGGADSATVSDPQGNRCRADL